MLARRFSGIPEVAISSTPSFQEIAAMWAPQGLGRQAQSRHPPSQGRDRV